MGNFLQIILMKKKNFLVTGGSGFIGSAIVNYLSSLVTTNDVSLILQMISCQMDSIIELIKKHDKLKEIQGKIISMVEVLNDIHKKKKHLSYVQEIDKIVKNIFKTAEIEDIEVQMMDTDDDEEFAKKLQEELYNNLTNNEI